MQTLKGRWRLVATGAAAALLCGATATSSSAQALKTADVIGMITAPFEEGGVAVPRCEPDPNAADEVVCKPVAQAVSVLKDGRVFYFNGIEGHENMKNGTGPDLAPEMRNSRARLLDLRSGTPQWTTPSNDNGGGTNPDVKPGHQGTDDPLGMTGVPGRPGDGLAGSTWGSLGGPEHNPTSSPDDPADNDIDMFCADIVSLADGRMAVVGGSDWYNEPVVLDQNKGDERHLGAVEVNGIRNVKLFNPDTNNFDQSGHMKYQRWYPSGVVLADGKMLVVGGVTKLIKSTQLSNIRRTETWDPATNSFTENYTGPESENSLPTQPRLFLAPNGKIFYGGAGQSWIPFGQAADEGLWALQQFFDLNTKQWEVVGVNPLGVHDTAYSAMLPMDPPYDKMSILTFGGTAGPSPGSWAAVPFSSITTVDKSGKLDFQMTGKLNHARWFPTGTPLPDGSVIATQGASLSEPVMPGTELAVRMIERWDPKTKQWSEMRLGGRDRTYHNTALMLPDARVLIGGHSAVGHFYGNRQDAGKPFPNNDADPSFEVFSPPYLFWGERPLITRVQSGIAWGETFELSTPKPDAVAEVLLMRVGSVQHSNDSDQRSLRLPFERQGDHLSVTAPPNGVAAAPGYYYLFVNRADDQGRGMIPSVARIVRISDTSDPAEAIQPMPDDAPAPVGGSASPEVDTSTGAEVQRGAGQAMRDAAASASGGADTVAQLPGRAVGSSRPAPSIPALPAASAVLAGASGLSARRWFRRARA
ncbi:MAG TPA: galactose oxidase early set domain-containing protein [Acidimicrobiia bacterium]|nr:galactose oxidase early set domain-containing protein [Acidimicrobiia bacterium]